MVIVLSTEALIKATRWQLGFPADADPGAAAVWRHVSAKGEVRERLAGLAEDLARRLLHGLMVRVGAGGPTSLPNDEVAMSVDLATSFWTWTCRDEQHRRFVAQVLHEGVRHYRCADRLVIAYLWAHGAWQDPRAPYDWPQMGVKERQALNHAIALRFQAALEQRLGLRTLPPLEQRMAETLLGWFAAWAADPRHSAFLAGRLKRRLRTRPNVRLRKAVPSSRPVAAAAAVPRPSPAVASVPAPAPAAVAPSAAVAPAAPVAPVSPAGPEPLPAPEPPPAPQPLPAPAGWLDLDVQDKLARHDYWFAEAASAPAGLALVGARVRGKKHRHEGTNCDDWFEFVTVGPWTLIAVSDGAGSKRFSRLGAKAACRAAVAHLAASLSDVVVAREHWTAETFARAGDDAAGAYLTPEVARVEQALHMAMRAAHEAVAASRRERSADPAYALALGRDLQLDDLACTLLLVAHTTVRSGASTRSFGLACQVGDGISALVMPDGRSQLLGIPDGGAFSGETEFVTSVDALAPEKLRRKTIPFLAPVQALMVMSDGVADDYFPAEAGMRRLYADLVLNRVLPAGASPAALGVSLPPVAAWTDERTVRGLSGLVDVRVHSLQALAEALGVDHDAIAADPARLAAATPAPIPGDEERPHHRLRHWLDAYHVRGSFDDRTLVILYPEAREP